MRELVETKYRDSWQLGDYWLQEADVLKMAADRIYNIWEDAVTVPDNFFKNKLFYDADVIRNMYEKKMFPIYMLLMGHAIENLIKGIIICQMWINNPDDFDEITNLKNLILKRKNGSNPTIITTHNFRELLDVDVVNIVASEDEKKLLKDLEVSIKWGGRYPAPKTADKSILQKGVVYFTGVKGEQSKPINDLYYKWSRELISLMKIQQEKRSRSLKK